MLKRFRLCSCTDNLKIPNNVYLVNNWPTLSSAAEFNNGDPEKEPQTVRGTVTCALQSVISVECMGGKYTARGKRMCIYGKKWKQ